MSDAGTCWSCGMAEAAQLVAVWLNGPRDGDTMQIGPPLCEACLVAIDKVLKAYRRIPDRKHAQPAPR